MQKKKNITKIFDEHYKEYDNWFDTHKEVYHAELAALRSLMPEHTTGVEIGVGTGRFALPLGITTGVEPSKEMAKHATSNGITVYNNYAEELPFSDNSFAYALMVTTICFVHDVDAALSEVYRILTDNGCALIAFVDKNSSIGQRYVARKDTSMFYKEATFFSTDEVIMHLKTAGFTQFTIVQTLLDDAEHTYDVIDGYGNGSFIVIKAEK